MIDCVVPGCDSLPSSHHGHPAPAEPTHPVSRGAKRLGRHRTPRATAHRLKLPAIAATLLLHLLAGEANGQTLLLKGTAEIVGPCQSADALPGVVVDTRTQNLTVDSLVALGSQAAILGELEAAREAFAQAATLDRTSAVISYRLARTLDDLGESGAAIAEYCRFLSLSPPAGEIAQVRERLQTLAVVAADREPDPWSMAMDQGIEEFGAGRFREAIQAFSRAIELNPDDPRGYFNRAMAYQADGRGDVAINDLEAYLARDPSASDRALVDRQIASLRELAGLPVRDQPVPSPTPPGLVLAQGLIVPGLGQHATGRTGLGALIFSAVAGSIYLGLREGVVTRRETGVDPFGNSYEYDVKTAGRPNLTLGISAAAAIALAGAIESYLFAAGRD